MSEQERSFSRGTLVGPLGFPKGAVTIIFPFRTSVKRWGREGGRKTDWGRRNVIKQTRLRAEFHRMVKEEGRRGQAEGKSRAPHLLRAVDERKVPYDEHYLPAHWCGLCCCPTYTQAYITSFCCHLSCAHPGNMYCKASLSPVIYVLDNPLLGEIEHD